MNVLKPTIEIHGPAAKHNMPCPVLYLADEHAVYDLNTGIFHPSWKAQQHGFFLIRVRTTFQKWLARTFF